MTAQVSDALVFQGNSYPLYSEPLHAWLSRRSNKGIRFQRIHTGCQRGYVAKWEVIDDRLYLTSIRGKFLLQVGASFVTGPECSVHDLFPGREQPVLADWVTGTLRCPFGERLQYVHSAYASIYEHELVLQFQSGVLKEYKIVDNQPPPPDDHDDDDHDESPDTPT